MEQNKYTAGFARLDITPPLGVKMIGAGPRTVKGVLDPLYVNAVAFGDGEQSAVVLACDLLGMYGSFGEQWPGKIAAEVGLDAEAVMLHCTHTHTGPSPVADAQYFDWTFRRLCDAARMALDDRKPVAEVRWAEDEMPKGFVGVRRYVMKDGSVRHRPPVGDPDIVRVVFEGDRSVRTVRILREEGKEIVIVNFQTHPDVVGGEHISADWPGAVRDTVERERPDACCIYLNGTQGQMVLSDRRFGVAGSRKSHGKAMEYGTTLGRKALELLEQDEPTGLAAFHYAQKTLELTSAREGSGGYDSDYPDTRNLNVSTMVFCGMALAGLAGEPYYQVGQHIRGYSKFPVTLTLCQTNGAQGYLPLLADFGHPGGSYEPRICHFAPGVAETAMITADELLRGAARGDESNEA